MNNFPEYVLVNDHKYKINTDFRNALKCQEISLDTNIGNYERVLGIIYTLFGDEGINVEEDYEKLLEMAIKYLKCGMEEGKTTSNEKPDMDLIQDYPFIEASFMSDYGIDLTTAKMHWYKFYRLLNGLTDKCVLNRIRDLRTYDLSTITEAKTRNKIKEMQKQFALVEHKEKKELTEEQKNSVDMFYKLTGIKRKE